MKKWVSGVIALIIFIVCIGLIIYGQRTVGYRELGLMLIGLMGMLGLLYAYNKKEQ